MKKLIVGVLCLPIFFVLNTLYAHSVLADACIGATCYSTIQEAIDAATVDDVINVQNGTYIDPVTISKQITIIGEDKDLTVVQTGTTNVGFSLLAGADSVVIKNIKFTGNGDGINASNVSNLSLQNLIIDNNSFSTSGIFLSDVSTTSISGTTFSNNIIGLDLVGTTNGVTVLTSTFSSNSTYHISNDTPNDVTATDNNSWGTFDGNAIDALLYDKKDDGALGRVIFDNTVPTVDAGTDKVVNTGFTQDATGTDTYGIASYLWEQISGPGFVSFDDPAIEDPLITADTEGTYELQLTITDTSGNSDTDIFQLIWDVTAPTLISKTTFGSGWYTSNQTSVFTYSDSGSASCNIITEGTNQICSVTPNVCDAAGNCNTATVTSNSIKLDKTNPTSSVTSPVYDNSGTIPLTYTSSDNLSGVSSVDLWYRLNGGAWTNYGVASSFDPAGVDGTYDFYSVATDNAGNVEVAPASADSSTIFDDTNPTGTWVTPVVNTTISGSTNLVINTDDNLSGVDTVVYKYAPDGSSTFTVISGTSWDTTPLALGKYTLRAVITDKAGNIYNVDESVYIAAVITSFSHFTVDTNRIQIDWTTDRPTDGKVVYDLNGHSNIGDYAFSTGTLDYGTTHSMIISGLSDNTYYYFRAVSAGTPIVISNQGWNKTFTVAGGGGGGGGGGGSPISNTPPATPPAPAAIQGQVAGVATEEPVVEELLPTPTPNPTPVVEGTATELPSFNWWLVIIPSPFVLGFLLWLARRLRS